MITAIARTEMEENIQACCKSLFLTSAIPEFIKEDGTPKQIEYLAGTPSEKKLSAGTRTSANVWSNAPGSRFIKRSTDMNTAV